MTASQIGPSDPPRAFPTPGANLGPRKKIASETRGTPTSSAHSLHATPRTHASITCLRALPEREVVRVRMMTNKRPLRVLADSAEPPKKNSPSGEPESETHARSHALARASPPARRLQSHVRPCPLTPSTVGCWLLVASVLPAATGLQTATTVATLLGSPGARRTPPTVLPAGLRRCASCTMCSKDGAGGVDRNPLPRERVRAPRKIRVTGPRGGGGGGGATKQGRNGRGVDHAGRSQGKSYQVRELQRLYITGGAYRGRKIASGLAELEPSRVDTSCAHTPTRPCALVRTCARTHIARTTDTHTPHASTHPTPHSRRTHRTPTHAHTA